jgi:dephospho-CoA kinase
MAREGVSEDYARLRVAAQKSDEWYREHCDIALVNEGDIDKFKRRCLESFSALLASPPCRSTAERSQL